MSKDIIEEQEKKYQKTKQSGDKILEVAGSIGMAMAPTTLMASLLGNGDLLQYIALVTGGTILLSPAIYHGMKYITTKLDERAKRDIHQVGQIGIMYQELDEKDHIINSMTSLFLKEILDKFSTDNPFFPEEQLMNINQFIYLINSNYYERIQKLNKEMSREKLIREIIEKISIYLNDTEREIFNEKDAEQSLYYMTFIPEELKKEIAKEFKKSKVTFADQTMYEIIRKDITEGIDEFQEKKKKETKGYYYGFNIEDGNDYYQLIQEYANDKYYLEQGYGDPRNLDWDIDFLRKIIKIMVRDHRDELIEQVQDYTVFHLVASFIDNALMYTLLNQRQQVGQEEMINTFKNWQYIPFNIKLSTLNTVFIEEQIDDSKHPYVVQRNKFKHQENKPPQKIIQFRPKQENKPE